MNDGEARRDNSRADAFGVPHLFASGENAQRLLSAYEQVLAGRFFPHDMKLGEPGMRLMWTDLGWEDYLSWQDDATLRERIHALLASALEDPAFGIGEPVAHTFALAHAWSRHIDGPHRVVYTVEEDDEAGRATLIVLQARFHD